MKRFVRIGDTIFDAERFIYAYINVKDEEATDIYLESETGNEVLYVARPIWEVYDALEPCETAEPAPEPETPYPGWTGGTISIPRGVTFEMDTSTVFPLIEPSIGATGGSGDRLYSFSDSSVLKSFKDLELHVTNDYEYDDGSPEV